MQPVYVADVADAMYNSLMEPSSVGETYTLCGPKEYTYAPLFPRSMYVQNNACIRGRVCVTE